MKLLVTGAAGFIGSTYVRQVLEQHPEDTVVSLDALTYAGLTANLAGLEGNPRHRFVQGSIADAALVDDLVGEGVDAIVNFAAETHVDRSLLDPEAFLATNVHGVYVLLDAARRHGVRLLQVSTDEVYGSSYDGENSKVEGDALEPTNPYAATKAAAENMVSCTVPNRIKAPSPASRLR